ncbi:NADH:ubiquinone oxidoreductase chain I-like protein [Candidatus Methanoperedens nitroreducens]|uniref:NADH:ubiquinone oxidoreductase chain I-like protein n=1 Tax=Candidatus Methanoperedens nitratireducens TaxID=1392998 RepID=A0A062V315_9EURY|nr:4Fe-4S dicluster domain-containing protein [Candidatus Methanoperedens nitroreducens]KCZ70988.1 NADH:ubiquinone oxidoreductase chain I-like protein [Candidatus Methanoperedens nitroreducens]MDJ1421642.1 4Fe-4S dicluster domain-containing protein [Candidatus Methanoperedens sp.]
MAVKKYEAVVTIEIDEDKCIGAGECVNVCPTNVFDLVEGKSHATRVEDCIECCACVDACPTKAIKHSTC